MNLHVSVKPYATRLGDLSVGTKFIHPACPVEDNLFMVIPHVFMGSTNDKGRVHPACTDETQYVSMKTGTIFTDLDSRQVRGVIVTDIYAKEM